LFTNKWQLLPITEIRTFQPLISSYILMGHENTVEMTCF